MRSSAPWPLLGIAAALLASAPAAAAKGDVLWVEICSGAAGEKRLLPLGSEGGELPDENRTAACHAACVVPRERQPQPKRRAKS